METGEKEWKQVLLDLFNSIANSCLVLSADSLSTKVVEAYVVVNVVVVPFKTEACSCITRRTTHGFIPEVEVQLPER